MGLIFGIIQSFLSAASMILTKKVLENRIIGNNWQTFVNRFYHLLIITLLFLLGFFNYNLNKGGIHISDYLILIIATLGLYFTYSLRRTAYANEKISVLQPYNMLSQVFPVIIGFIFISSERAHIITFLSALAASLIVVLGNISIKNPSINRYSLMILLSSIIKSFQVFCVIYFLKKINPASFYFTESIIVIIISALLLVFNKELGQIKLITRKYSKLMFYSNTLAIVSILLSLTMYSTLGIVFTNLLGLLYLVFVYIFGYFSLKEIPTKKDILITILVSACIVLGVLFKN